jgi:hypothetical protein
MSQANTNEDYAKVAIDYHAKRLKQLIGAKITKVIVDPTEFPNGIYLGFIVEKNKKTWEVIAYSDEEGNSAGSLSIIEVDNTKPPPPIHTSRGLS